MGLSDIAGILSRYFVVGFFVPASGALTALTLAAEQGDVPASLRLTDATGPSDFIARLAPILAVALPAAFVLSGVWSRVFALYRALPYFGFDVRMPESARSLVLWYQRRRFTHLFDDKFDPDDASKRSAAAATLTRRFPSRVEHVQPSRFGNVVRAYEDYARDRWGLDFRTVWPMVEADLSDSEQPIYDDARTQLAFTVNLSFALALAALATFVSYGAPWHSTWPDVARWGGLAAGAYAVYRLLTVEAAVEVGNRIRAAVDMHRLDLYTVLGARKVRPFSPDERALGEAVSAYLLYGLDPETPIGQEPT